MVSEAADPLCGADYPSPCQMNAVATFFLWALAGAVLFIIIFWIGSKACCAASFGRHLAEAFTFGSHNHLNYAAPGSDEAEAQLYQSDYLPPASELTEDGGGFAQAEGIQSPLLSPRKDPWNDKTNYL